MSNLKTYLINLNLFSKDFNENENENENNNFGKISTRIYIFILILILIILLIIFLLTSQTQIITIHHPTKDQYKILPDNAQCPCSRISISYGEFLTLQANIHELCSSDFVTNRWIKAIDLGSSSAYLFPSDFRRMASAQFQSLANFCDISKKIIEENINTFNKNIFISLNILSEKIFQLQIQSIIHQFQSTIAITFQTQLELLRQITFNDQLISGLQTNFYFVYSLKNQSTLVKRAVTYIKSVDIVCSCAMELECASKTGIFPVRDQSVWLMTVSGMVSGCLTVESLLLSTLICFYNQTCVNQLISYFYTKQTFTAMSTTVKSQYQLNSTIKSILDQLMIEEWINNISYEKYYQKCLPTLCTYTILQKHDFIFILTKILGLLTTLTLILKILIPFVVKLVQKRLKRKHERFLNTPKLPRK